MKITMIRHGKTSGNLEKRYVGATDESLCDLGREEVLKRREELRIGKVQALFVSPKCRCIETAKILFEGQYQIVIDDLKECDFGDWEMKNWVDLQGDPEYQAFIDSNGTSPFPNGESLLGFQKRSMDGFEQVLSYCKDHQIEDEIALVVHGGTIMAICAYLENRTEHYFEYSCSNVEGYEIILDTREEKNVICMQRLVSL